MVGRRDAGNAGEVRQRARKGERRSKPATAGADRRRTEVHLARIRDEILVGKNGARLSALSGSVVGGSRRHRRKFSW